MTEKLTFELSKDVEDKMVEHASEDAPLETCAVLFGSELTIDDYYPMENTDESEVHFTFDPQQQLKAMKEARSRGKDIIGIYHSHPAIDSQAYPSEEDRRHGWEEYVYFILSFTNDDYNLGAFEFHDGDIIEHDYEVVTA
ncbi:MAG: Mov34/MPN/PAD-1 family protein [bacterium]